MINVTAVTLGKQTLAQCIWVGHVNHSAMPTLVNNIKKWGYQTIKSYT